MYLRKVLALAACAAILLAGCSQSTNNEELEEDKQIPVSVINIERSDIENINNVVGKVLPVQDINIYSKLSGKVVKVYADVGEKVTKGQILFSLDDTDIKHQLNQAQAALNSAQANLERTRGGSMDLQMSQLRSNLSTAELNLKDSKLNLDNTKMLYDSGAVSKQMLDGAELKYNIALEQYNAAKSTLELTQSQINSENIATVQTQVDQARAAYNSAKSQLDNINVVSTIDGIVAGRSVDEGELVSGAVPAFNLVDLSNVNIEINILENILSSVSVGERVEVHVSSADASPFSGEVKSISPNANPQNQTYSVMIEVPNPDGKLKGGMLANVKLVSDARVGVLVVPIDAVLDVDGKKAVYVVNNDEAMKKEVTVGLSNDRQIEISGDISENDRVIIKGQNLVEDKAKIKVVD